MKRHKLVWTCPRCREELPQYVRTCPTCPEQNRPSVDADIAASRGLTIAEASAIIGASMDLEIAAAKSWRKATT